MARPTSISMQSCRRAASTKTRIETKVTSYTRYYVIGRRAASTKTRIETSYVCRIKSIRPCRRAASTKTRIETYWSILVCAHNVRVAGRHPLKQGLKPISTYSSYRYPQVAGRHPLKQGLKHGTPRVPNPPDAVAGRHPLKQGLKPISFIPSLLSSMCRRAASTKTRIET